MKALPHHKGFGIAKAVIWLAGSRVQMIIYQPGEDGTIQSLKQYIYNDGKPGAWYSCRQRAEKILSFLCARFSLDRCKVHIVIGGPGFSLQHVELPTMVNKEADSLLCDALDVANDKEKIVYGLQYVGRTLDCMFDWIVVKYQQQQYRWIIETLALRDVTIGKIIFVSDVMRHFFCQHKGKVYIEDGDHAHCCDLDCHSTAAYEWLEDGIPACAVGPRNGCQHSLITDPFTAMKSLK